MCVCVCVCETEFMCFNQDGTISLNVKLVDKFTYLSSNISSTERDVNICIGKAWTTIERLSIKWKFDQFDKLKRELF